MMISPVDNYKNPCKNGFEGAVRLLRDIYQRIHADRLAHPMPHTLGTFFSGGRLKPYSNASPWPYTVPALQGAGYTYPAEKPEQKEKYRCFDAANPDAASKKYHLLMYTAAQLPGVVWQLQTCAINRYRTSLGVINGHPGYLNSDNVSHLRVAKRFARLAIDMKSVGTEVAALLRSVPVKKNVDSKEVETLKTRVAAAKLLLKGLRVDASRKIAGVGNAAQYPTLLRAYGKAIKEPGVNVNAFVRRNVAQLQPAHVAQVVLAQQEGVGNLTTDSTNAILAALTAYVGPQRSRADIDARAKMLVQQHLALAVA